MPKEMLINRILLSIDPDIIKISKIYSSSYWEEVAQDTRIHMWQVIENNYIRQFSEAYILENMEDILLNCTNLLIFYARIAKKSVLREHLKYNDQNIALEDFSNHLSYDFNYHHIDFDIDYPRYCKLLDSKELPLFEYICKTNPSQINYDEISRQLGYTSKNGIKYNLVKIAQKIANEDAKHNKT